MKKITILVIALILLVLGCYYGMGVITERTIKNDLAVVNQSNGLYAEVVNYNRGMFKSEALLNWNLHLPARLAKSANGQMEPIPAQDYRVAMPLIIYHGPVIFSDHGIKLGLGYANTNLALPSNLLDQFNAMFTPESTHPQMQVSLFVDYLNNSEIGMDVPQFNLIAKQGNMKFDWMGMSSSVQTSSSLNEISGQFSVDGVRFTQDKMVMKFGKISGKYNLHKTDSGLFLGEASTIVPSVIINNGDEKIFEMDEFNINSNTDIQKNLFSAGIKTSLDKLFANGRIYGPGHLELAIKNLDALVLANINAQINKAQQSTDLEKQQAMLAVLPELPKLFAEGAEFDISTMDLVVPEGKVDGNLTISLPAGGIINPFELIQKVEGNGNLRLPMQLVNEMVAQSIQQKLMSKALAPQTVNVATKAETAVTGAATETAGSTSTSITSSTTNVSTEDIAAAATKNVSTHASNTTQSIADINQQAVIETQQQIKSMIDSGLLVQQGTDYLLAFKLSQGQLMVNGKPFSAAMLKF
jgi:uncharacterized protein YdgA (DUF945 family)